MRFARVLLHRLRSLFRKSDQDASLENEIQIHFEQLVHEGIASGLSDSEARAEARRQFGPLEITKEHCRDQRRMNQIDSLRRDLRYALRMIRVKPGFSVPVLLSLAMGIGGNIAIFSIVNAVLIRPLPYANPEQLVGVANSASFSGKAIPVWPLSLEMYAAFEANARSFEEFGVWSPGAAAVTYAGKPEQVPTVAMTYGVLRALRVSPLLGRWFSKADERPGGQRAVILSYRYWRTKLGGDPAVIGKLLVIDFVPHQFGGVMPLNFEFL